MNRIAVIRITPDLLRDWMPLPHTADIIGSRECIGYIEVVVESPDLDPVEEGAALPIRTPVFQKNVPVEFVEWGPKW